MKAWGNLPFSLRRENTENAVANATRVHPWDVKNKTGSWVQTTPRVVPFSTDVPVLLLNHSIIEIERQLVNLGCCFPNALGFVDFQYILIFRRGILANRNVISGISHDVSEI